MNFKRLIILKIKIFSTKQNNYIKIFVKCNLNCLYHLIKVTLTKQKPEYTIECVKTSTLSLHFVFNNT